MFLDNYLAPSQLNEYTQVTSRKSWKITKMLLNALGTINILYVGIDQGGNTQQSLTNAISNNQFRLSQKINGNNNFN